MTINKSVNSQLSKSHASELETQQKIYAYLTGSIGNFIPCASAFQRRYIKTLDYWDLTMFGIKEFFDAKIFNSDKTIKKLNIFPMEFFEKCSGWLKEVSASNRFAKQADPWVNFVDNNFLNPYVNENYAPLPFYGDIENRMKNKNPNGDNILTCIRKMNACIIARGNLMIKELGDDFRKVLYR